jgi:hypothetical protein
VDRPDHERPRQSRPPSALGLDNMTEDGLPGPINLPPVPAREAVRPRDAEPAQASALMGERFVAQEADAVRTQLRPHSVRPHSTRIVNQRSDVHGRGRELALVNRSNRYQRLPLLLPRVRLRIPMRNICMVASSVATANRMKPVQLRRIPNAIAPAADPIRISTHSSAPSRRAPMRPPLRRSPPRPRRRGTGSRARG